MGERLVLSFKQQLLTKGAIRYGEVLPSGGIASAPNDTGAKVGTLYMRKDAFPSGKFPENLSVTIETEEEGK